MIEIKLKCLDKITKISTHWQQLLTMLRKIINHILQTMSQMMMMKLEQPLIKKFKTLRKKLMMIKKAADAKVDAEAKEKLRLSK
jgi:hypothetical protein